LKMDPRMRVPTSAVAWTRGKSERIAGVSSFGFGGTNAHVIVKEAPVLEPESAEVERPAHLLALSARSPKMLDAVVERYLKHLVEHRNLGLADICYTANTGRNHFDQRLAVWASSVPQLAARLRNGVIAGVRSKSAPKIGFTFVGDSAGWADAGALLYRTQPTFKRVVDRFTAEAKSRETVYERAMVATWKAWGIEPSDEPAPDFVVSVGFAKGEDVWETLLRTLATLFVKGAPVSWTGFDIGYARRRVSLPTTPFDRIRCWMSHSEIRPMPGPLTKIKGKSGD
jgi:acyl transferase domain-containing protein